MRIFNRYSDKMDRDDKNSNKNFKVPEEVIRLKKRIFDLVDKKLKENKRTVKDLF